MHLFKSKLVIPFFVKLVPRLLAHGITIVNRISKSFCHTVPPKKLRQSDREVAESLCDSENYFLDPEKRVPREETDHSTGSLAFHFFQ